MKKLIMMACAAAVVLHATCALAGAAAVKLPPYTERTLPNGLRVFIMETREVPLVTAALVVPAGSAADGPGAEGIANLTSRLLMKGAGGMTADEIAEAIEAVGGDMRCGTSRDYSSAYASFMAKDLALAVDMLAKIALSPSFPEEEIAREKSLVAAAILGTLLGQSIAQAIATIDYVQQAPLKSAQAFADLPARAPMARCRRPTPSPCSWPSSSSPTSPARRRPPQCR